MASEVGEVANEVAVEMAAATAVLAVALGAATAAIPAAVAATTSTRCMVLPTVIHKWLLNQLLHTSCHPHRLKLTRLHSRTWDQLAHQLQAI